MPSPSLPPYSFGQVIPSHPRSPTSAMKRRRRGRVHDLSHVLPGQIEDLGIVVGIEELLDLFGEFELLGGELEVHGSVPPGRPPAARCAGQYLTHRQISCVIIGWPARGDHRAAAPTAMTSVL